MFAPALPSATFWSVFGIVGVLVLGSGLDLESLLIPLPPALAPLPLPLPAWWALFFLWVALELFEVLPLFLDWLLLVLC